jgi:hypothetical protein
MYNIKLSIGDKLQIRVNENQEDSQPEGVFELLEFVREEQPFYLDYERLYKPSISRSSLVQTDKTQNKLNDIYEYIDFYLNKDNPEIRNFKQVVLEASKRKSLCKYNTIYKEIKVFTERFKMRPTHIINNIFNEIPIRYIVRYFEQQNDNWEPSLFVMEKWIVKRIPETPFDSSYVCSRKIKRLYLEEEFDEPSNWYIGSDNTGLFIAKGRNKYYTFGEIKDILQSKQETYLDLSNMNLTFDENVVYKTE